LHTAVRKESRPKRTVSLGLTIITVILFSLVCILAGYVIGYKFFWQKFSLTSKTDQAIAAYTLKVKQNPKDLDALVKLTWLNYQKKQYDLAVQSGNLALNLDSKQPDIHYVFGSIYLEKKDYGAAEEQFSLLYKSYPKNALVLSGLAQTYLAQNKPQQAIPVLESLVRLDKALVEGHLMLGEAYFDQHKNAQAVEEFRIALTFNPDNKTAKEWLEKLGQNDLKSSR